MRGRCYSPVGRNSLGQTRPCVECVLPSAYAAYFLDAIDTAVDNFTLARDTARNVSDNRKALGGSF